MSQLEQLLTLVADARIVAISGFGGSGKSTLARQLTQRLGDRAIVSIDEFWQPQRDQVSEDWQAFDRDRLKTQVLIPASQGEPIRYQVFDWNQGKLGDWRTVTGLLIVEGISVLHPDLNSYYSFKIWVDCPLEVAQARGLERGRTEYHVDETEAWLTRWSPNDRAYFQKYRPDLQADFRYSTL